MANPSKGGDAKPRVYNHAQRDHDSPVTEDKNHFNYLREPGDMTRLIFWNLIIRSIKANPLKNGDAKPRI
jgi:hypothetical protein